MNDYASIVPQVSAFTPQPALLRNPPLAMMGGMAKPKLIPTPKDAAQRRKRIRSFKAKADAKRSSVDKVADLLVALFGTTAFFGLHAVFFAFWIVWNVGLIPDIAPVDALPFNFLTMIVSLEAIFLAIIVLISQNREERVAELREEVELYINTYAEQEITKLMYLQTLLLKKNGIDISSDPEVQQMLKALESDEIERELEKQLEKG
jgi:uncharacterized membrane protein